MDINKIYHGSNIDVIKGFPDNSIDSIVTDPPYGLGDEPDSLEVLKSWITTGFHEIKGRGFMGKKWDAFVPQPLFWKECLRVLKPGGYLLSFAGTRTYDWVVMGLRVAGFQIRDQIVWAYTSGYPKSQNISLAIDKSKGLQGNLGHGLAAYQVGKREKNTDEPMKVYNPVSPEAKRWLGWGTSLKPAIEPIVMARKPLAGKMAENIEQYGTGGINLDESRVGDASYTQRERHFKSKGIYGDNSTYAKEYVGKFPANIILESTKEVKTAIKNIDESGEPYFKEFKAGNKDVYYDESKRFFFVPKPSQKERNWGLNKDDLDLDIEESKDAHLEDTDRPNIHPTIKPIDLMRYLVKLVTPQDGLCMDPYVGSGTTAIACKAEKINYIGIDQDENYVKIAEARIKAEPVIFTIFDFL
jgi:DNA modification methylase